MVAGHQAGDRRLAELLSGMDGSPDDWPEAWRTYERKAFPRFVGGRTLLPKKPDHGWDGRKSIRRFDTARSIAPEILSEILESVRIHPPITGESTPHRETPSAGALYPIECYWISRNAVHYYDADDHALIRLWAADPQLFSKPETLIGSTPCRGASGYLVLTYVLYRNMRKYGARGYRYGLLEAGAILQQMSEHARSLGVGCVWLGGFDDQVLADMLGLRPRLDLEVPLIISALGYPAER